MAEKRDNYQQEYTPQVDENQGIELDANAKLALLEGHAIVVFEYFPAHRDYATQTTAIIRKEKKDLIRAYLSKIKRYNPVTMINHNVRHVLMKGKNLDMLCKEYGVE